MSVCVLFLQTALPSRGGWAGQVRHTCTGVGRFPAVSSVPVDWRITASIPNTSATVMPTAKSGTPSFISHNMYLVCDYKTIKLIAFTIESLNLLAITELSKTEYLSAI